MAGLALLFSEYSVQVWRTLHGYDALQALSAAQTGVFLYIEPLVAVIVAFFVLGEPVTLVSLVGGGIILPGVWLVNR